MKLLKLVRAGPQCKPFPQRPVLQERKAAPINQKLGKIVRVQAGAQLARAAFSFGNDPLDGLALPSSAATVQIIENRAKIRVGQIPSQHLNRLSAVLIPELTERFHGHTPDPTTVSL
ncbi:hypothetical protein [Actinomadura gamaensis]|uniref:Uncharacterized protein n=1 Tax=Actinomadura gamaensis TaxID=1763541 RepID=A0ABV9UGM4_9ACTN